MLGRERRQFLGMPKQGALRLDAPLVGAEQRRRERVQEQLVGVALGQFWPQWTSIAAVVGVFLVGQFVEGNVLAPKLVGDHVGLHPVWLIFAMFAFGYLLGFVGLLIAVPLAAAIAVLFRFGLSRYFASPFYQGEETG